jgi:hypothetical protein
VTMRDALRSTVRPVLTLVVCAFVFSVLFAIGSLIVYGHVKWK